MGKVIPIQKERPIIFSAPMVNALLGDAKTQTRRIVALREFGESNTPGYDWTFRDKRGLWNDYGTEKLLESKHNPYGPPGSRLWVRETWQPIWAEGQTRPPASFDTPDGWNINYTATGGVIEFHDPDRGLTTRCMSPIHMPRWASRITLEITHVRVQRLHAITQEDARAEGTHECHADFDAKDVCVMAKELGCSAEDPLPWYALLWNQINGERAPWASNPWVWALTFRRLA